MSFLVVKSVMRQLDAAARAVPPGFEIGGRLLVGERPDRENVILYFHQLPNLQTEPFLFSCRLPPPPPGYRQIHLHSHPDGFEERPSVVDVTAAWHLDPTRGLLAIFSVEAGRLAVWRITRGSRVYRMPVEVEGEAIDRSELRAAA